VAFQVGDQIIADDTPMTAWVTTASKGTEKVHSVAAYWSERVMAPIKHLVLLLLAGI
jgi:hypothetical protein